MTTALHTLLASYAPDENSYEKVSQLQCLHLLATQPRCLWRDCFTPGHFTGSAWVVNPSFSKVLLIHHPKLHKWIQFGGHADGDANLLAVAMKELEEECGYGPQQATPLTTGIFDLDVHYYPARLKNGVMEPEHLHHDVRFCVIVDDTIPIPGSEENQTVQWVSLDEAEKLIEPENSCQRMLAKTRALAASAAKAA